MKPKTAKKILESVKDTYNHIAEEFSDSRGAAWKDFEHFLPYLHSVESRKTEILDLGCGNGRFLNFLEEKATNFHYTGIDNSKNLIHIAAQKHPNNNFLLGDFLEIPAPDEQFNAIVSIAAFHHLPTLELRKKALQEMLRVLKPGGIMILTTWNLWQKKYWRLALNAFSQSISSDTAFNDFFVPWGKEKTPRYYHAFTPPELIKVVNKAKLNGNSFEIIETFSVKKGQKMSFLKSFNFCLIAKKHE